MDKGMRVYVRIRGKGFNLVSDERPEYMTEIANEIDSRMGELMESNKKLTYDLAAVLTALNLCDELKKEKLLNQITVDKTEVEALQKKLTAAEDTIAELKKQAAQEAQEHKNAMEKMRLEWAVREKEILDMIDEEDD